MQSMIRPPPVRGFLHCSGGGSRQTVARHRIGGFGRGGAPNEGCRAMRARGTEAGGRNGSPIQSGSLLAALLAALLLVGPVLDPGLNLTGPDEPDRADG